MNDYIASCEDVTLYMFCSQEWNLYLLHVSRCLRDSAIPLDSERETVNDQT